jgi:hypothetical protein
MIIFIGNKPTIVLRNNSLMKTLNPFQNVHYCCLEADDPLYNGVSINGKRHKQLTEYVRCTKKIQRE